MLRRLGPTHLLIGRAKAPGCCCLVGDDLSHRAMVGEYPWLAGRYVSGRSSLLDLLPCAVRRETDHGIPSTGAGSAGLAGGVRVSGGADRNPSSGRRVARQSSRTVTPVADRLGPLVSPSFEPVPNRAPGVGSGQHGHDGGDPQVGQSVRMCGIVGRENDREAGLDGRSDKGPVLDSDRIVAEHGLVSEGDGVLAAVGGDELVEQLSVDLRTVSGQVACLGVAPETAGAERCDLCAELRPGPACRAPGYSIPVHSEGASFSVAAILVERAAGPA